MKTIQNTEKTEFEISLAGSNEFYECITVLRKAGVTVHSFTEIEPDLEDVFVDIISSNAAPKEQG